MTEHSIEELKRQMEAAQSRYVQAEKDYRKAQNNVSNAAIAAMEARLAKRGITPGCKVRCVNPRWTGPAIFGFIGLKDMWPGRGKPDLILTKIKKDGTVGNSSLGLRLSLDEIEIAHTE